MPLDGNNFEQGNDLLERLRRGRELIARPDGWCQGCFKSAHRFCAIGALKLEERFVVCQPVISLYDALPRWSKIRYWHASRWDAVCHYNNGRRRTKDQIIALYDRAIVRLEREGGRNGAE